MYSAAGSSSRDPAGEEGMNFEGMNFEWMNKN